MTLFRFPPRLMVLQVGRSTSTGKSSEARSANGLKWSRVSSQARIKIPCPAQPDALTTIPRLQGRRQRRLLQADPQTRVREPPPGLPPLRPLCPQGPAQRRHIRPGAKWIPRLNPDEPQLLCKTRKKKSRCGPSTNGIPSGPERRNPRGGSSSNSRGIIQRFFRWQRLFAHPRRFFTPALRRKSSRPLIYIETNCLYQ